MSIRNIISSFAVFLVIFSMTLKAGEISRPLNPSIISDAAIISNDGVYRIKRSTAAALWRASSSITTFAPVVVENTVLVGSSSGLRALSFHDGSTLWSAFKSETIYSPIVKDGLAYAVSQNGVVRALEVSTGTLKWPRQLSGWLYGPALAAEHLVTGGSDRQLWGIDAASGAIAWSRAIDQEMFGHPSSVSATEIAYSTFSGLVSVVTAVSGESRWERKLGSAQQLLTRPEQGLLVVVGLDGRLQRLSPETGESLWRRELGFTAMGAPSIVADAVVIIGDSGEVTGYHLTDGLLAYRFVHDTTPYAVAPLSSNCLQVFSQDRIEAKATDQPGACAATKLAPSNAAANKHAQQIKALITTTALVRAR